MTKKVDVQTVLAGIDGRIAGRKAEGEVSAICFAADRCVPGSLFVAVRGLVHDGHDFIGRALERGARYIVHSKDVTLPDEVVSIRVPDCRRALGRLAKNFFRDPSSRLTLIGVTGTSGKTTVSYLLEAILAQAGFSTGVVGTVNYRYAGKTFPAPNTTPESSDMQAILRDMLDAGITHVIAEVSSHALDLKRVDDCDFDLGIFTNLSPEHLDYHQDMDDYFRAKKRLFTEVLAQSRKGRSPRAIINADDEWGRKLRSDLPGDALMYGLSVHNEIRLTDESISLDGISATLRVGEQSVQIYSPLIGRFNLSNILAAAAAAHLLGVEPSVIASGIASLHGVPGRLERVPSAAGIHVFVDYAHKPDALHQVLSNLDRLKQKKILTVFGCGGNRDRAKRPLMGETAVRLSDLTIVTSDNPRREDPLAIIDEILAGIDSEKYARCDAERLSAWRGERGYAVIADRREAIAAAVKAAQTGDIILIAGKGHEDYQILGVQKVPFDDRLEAARALQTKEGRP
ncbi:MAG TPA: UDP-N-acetylmuramoyl-L-alanyl-D-glutamate--2,6-diaminopimelate ligase [Smithellaceae bacterium]|nr:UDP-N-acetylmuramoyl-L-alanyl-D-glutamate--2,6-diaminopimelate ligase [Smithellaceae bacterium]